MNRLSLLLFQVMLGTSLLAQSADSNAVREERYALITLTKYCAGVETLSDSQQPRMFAQVSSGLGRSSGWAEFESKAAWKQAGKPTPLALVWYKDSQVIRLAITAVGADGQYADYCYRPDGSLAQFRSLPAVQTNCDQSLFHCDVKFRGGLRLYPPRGMLTALVAQGHGQESSPVVQAPDFDLYDLLFLRPLKPERTTVSVAPTDWPEYLSVWDLPFNRLLYVYSKMTK